MKQIFSIIAVTVLFLSAGGEVAEAKKPEKPKGPYRAVIIIEGIHSREGVGNFKAISIVASKLVSQLESFFPKYRQ